MENHRLNYFISRFWAWRLFHWHFNRDKLRQSTCGCTCVNPNGPDNLLHKLKGMPGLPIFGTVSAASSPENKLSVLGSDLVPFESSPVSSKPSRVSQVK